MAHITEDMTFAQIEALTYMGRAAGFLMDVKPQSREGAGQTTVAMGRQMMGDAAADRMLAGLERLYEAAREYGRPDVELWGDEEISEVPARANTRLFRFPGKSGAPFVLVISGGGYCSVCNAMEGFPFAAVLNAAGYNAFVLSYRVREAGRMPAPIEDAAQALRVILRNAEELGVDARYALAGFSAGAHLAGELSTDNWGWRRWGLPRPEALVLNYPAVDLRLLAAQPRKSEVVWNMLRAMLGSTWTSADVEEFDVIGHVCKDCPPTYLWQAKDDKTIPVASSRNMAKPSSGAAYTTSTLLTSAETMASWPRTTRTRTCGPSASSRS